MNTTTAPQTQYLQLPGGTIAFDDTLGTAAEGSTPVVLLPGMLEPRASFRYLHPLLTAAGQRVITVDLRGLGESSLAWDDYSPAALAEDVVALLDHLKIDRAILVGHSYTGATVLKVATTAPAKVAGIVLLNAFVEQPEAGAFKRAMVHALGTCVIHFPKFWGFYLNKIAFPTTKPADHSEYIARQVQAARTPGRKQATRGYARGNSAPVGWTEGVRCPALVVMGGKDPDFTDPELVANRQAAALNARKVMIDGAGHYSMTDHPEATAAALLPFFTEVA
ncbi:alpha/beta fold hydrolase [Kitasatospora kifunensis]|uniref:Pimeloyl-ACP methyl ester carboxylesterase n=1 Tax=Kitasatospora kifunensis TaxID=58351 RepID=A0A7W7R2J3_KITKI|nr:alpha/beta hydrolase [Kitasatospora kifunensis]MBB4924243.1 pimeloyl-ACP methyl ester carboxylesterase [Kitasatospora kifunensis]